MTTRANLNGVVFEVGDIVRTEHPSIKSFVGEITDQTSTVWVRIHGDELPKREWHVDWLIQEDDFANWVNKVRRTKSKGRDRGRGGKANIRG